MSYPPHTSGPWDVVERGYGADIEPSVAWIGYGSAHSKEVHKANARLIAAAPELLEALKDIATWLSNWDCPMFQENEWQATEDAMKAAIAKAEGTP